MIVESRLYDIFNSTKLKDFSLLETVDVWPAQQKPNVFGLHANTAIGYAVKFARSLWENLQNLLPETDSVTGIPDGPALSQTGATVAKVIKELEEAEKAAARASRAQSQETGIPPLPPPPKERRRRKKKRKVEKEPTLSYLAPIPDLNVFDEVNDDEEEEEEPIEVIDDNEEEEFDQEENEEQDEEDSKFETETEESSEFSSTDDDVQSGVCLGYITDRLFYTQSK